MAIVKNLDKNLLKKDDRFTFIADWGEGWRTFGYKGLELETKRTGGKTYLHIGIGNLDKGFTVNEWRATAERELMGLFNGVEDIDVERLVEICDKILAGIDRLNEQVKDEELDVTPVIERLNREVADARRAVEVAKKMDWWKLDDYDVRWASHSINYVETYIGYALEKAEKLPTMTRKEKAEALERLESSKWSMINPEDIDKLYKWDAKCKEVET